MVLQSPVIVLYTRYRKNTHTRIPESREKSRRIIRTTFHGGSEVEDAGTKSVDVEVLKPKKLTQNPQR